VLRGELEDQAELNYLRDAVGLLTFLLDHSGVAVCDPWMFHWWGPGEWMDRVFRPGGAVPRHHVVIFTSEEPEGPSPTWFHTRGMRKFGHPDLSVHGVPPEHREAVIPARRRGCRQLHGRRSCPTSPTMSLSWTNSTRCWSTPSSRPAASTNTVAKLDLDDRRGDRFAGPRHHGPGPRSRVDQLQLADHRGIERGQQRLGQPHQGRQRHLQLVCVVVNSSVSLRGTWSPSGTPTAPGPAPTTPASSPRPRPPSLSPGSRSAPASPPTGPPATSLLMPAGYPGR
jgi:hypothetical protein